MNGAQVSSRVGTIATAITEQVSVDARYAVYLRRQESDIFALRKDEGVLIPRAMDYRTIAGLSAEVLQKLERHRPSTLAQAARIDGVTPAALMLVLAHVKKAPRLKSA